MNKPPTLKGIEMRRTFELTLAVADTSYSLWTLILATDDAVPTEGYLPDKVCSLTVQADRDNTGIVTLTDVLGLGGTEIEPGFSYENETARNSIFLPDIYIKPTDAGDKINVSIIAA